MNDRATRKAGALAREEGRAAFILRKAAAANPYAAGSFERQCWEAGFRQDVRSIDQLLADFARRSEP